MRRFGAHGVVLLLLVGVTLALTLPVVLTVGEGSALPGLKDFDEFEYTWLVWWYKASLVDRGISPGNLPFYYPMQTQQPLVDISPLGWLIPVPLVMLLDPVRAYVVYWLVLFVLCGFTAYLLAYWLIRSRPAAIIGGLIFTFYSGKMLHAVGHMSDMMIYMFPLYALFLIRFFERPVFRRAAMLIVVTTLGLLIDSRHIVVFYIPFTAIFLLYQMVTAPRRLFSRSIISLGLLSVGAVFLLTLPFLGSFLLNSLGGELPHLKAGGLLASSADVLSFVLPPMTHPVLGQVPFLKSLMQAVWTESLYIETCLYLGVTVVILAVVALARRRGAWFWLIPVLVGMVFALGPVLKVAGVQVSDWPLPYSFLYRLPFYEWFRTPNRMDMMIKFALAMLAAMGTAELIRSLRRGRQVAVVAALGGLILFEYWTFMPYPMADVAPSPFLEGLANDGEEYGILHISSHEYAMYLQTLHGHPMVEGHIHRFPPGGIEWALQMHGMALYPPQSERPYWDIIEDQMPYGRDGAGIFAGTLDVAPSHIMSNLNIRYVVFDRRGAWTPDDKKLYKARLRGYFGDPIDEDDRLTIHEVPRDLPGVPKLTPGTGWYPLEGGLDDRWRWITDQATVEMVNVPDWMYRLLLVPRSPPSPRHLTVGIDGDTLKEYVVESDEGIITPAFPLTGDAIIKFAVQEGCQRPYSLLQGNLDERCLGLGLSEIRLFPALEKSYQFGNQVALLGYEATSGTGADNGIYVNLYWQALNSMAQDYTVFVHAVDAEGGRIAQDDRALLNQWEQPTSTWKGVEGLRTLHRLELPQDVNVDELRFKVGIYDLATMDRLPLGGEESEENAVMFVPDTFGQGL